MKHLAKLTSAFFSLGPPEPAARRLHKPDVRDWRANSVSKWDEALAAAMGDENAHMVLDHWGPRWK